MILGDKSELQKMLAGELYLASDPELVRMRLRARKLTRAFNFSTEEELDLRAGICRELFARVGSNLIIDCAEVRFGDGVLCGPNVQIYAATHPLEAQLRAQGPELAKPISIGNRVWIGGGAIIGPGVTVGDNSTIGAGSVVTKDIPANVFAAGNPCRVIRTI